MGWLIALGILTTTALLPLGFRVTYRQDGTSVWILIGPAAVLIYPGSGKKKDKPQNEKSKRAADSKSRYGGSLKDFQPLLNTVLRFLGDFRRRISIRHMELRLVLAGDDPCDLAVNYGRAWAIVGNILPQLESLFNIKKRKVEVACDFVGEATSLYLRLDAVISAGRLLMLLIKYGFCAFQQYKNIHNLRKGGAKL